MTRPRQTTGRSLAVAIALAAAIILPGGMAAADDAALCLEQAPHGDTDNCRVALETDPANLGLRRALARGLLVAGDEAGSLATYEAIAVERPRDARAQYDYVVTLIALHHYNHGAELLTKAIGLDPEYRDAQLAASIIFAQLGRQEAAFEALHKAAELGSDLAMFELAEAYRIGFGTAADETAAFDWLIRAGEAGHILAMDVLVDVYLEGGYGVAPDDALAEQWALRAYKARQ